MSWFRDDVTYQILAQITRRLDRIESLLSSLNKRTMSMATDLKELETEVARNRDVDESALALIQGIAAKLEEAKNDPQKVAELAASLRSSSDALAAAVTANTSTA